MSRVSITELKAKLSEYLSAVRAGEEIVVTDRGRPVARVSPIRGEREMESRTSRLVRAGLIRPPTSPRPPDVGALLESAIEDADGRIRKSLIEERRTSR